MAMQQHTAAKTALQTNTARGLGEIGTHQRQKKANVAVIRCEGEMGDMELANIAEELFRLDSRGLSRVILDLSRTTHVDYRGIGGLLRCALSLRAHGGDLKLSGLSNYVATIFRAAGFEDAFQCFESTDDAKLSFLTTQYCLRH